MRLAVQGVGAVVKERISSAAKGQAEGQRPMLLFPEGTTTNGMFLLPFKSGAFLAGCPLQPVILQYQQVSTPFLHSGNLVGAKASIGKNLLAL